MSEQQTELKLVAELRNVAATALYAPGLAVEPICLPAAAELDLALEACGATILPLVTAPAAGQQLKRAQLFRWTRRAHIEHSMPVVPVKHIASVVENGVGAFVQPCKRITLRYCNWGGSSQGMRELLRTQLRSIAAGHPKVEFVVQKKSGHPIVQGEYAGGKTKTVCVRNYDVKKILEKIELVQNASGDRLKKYQRAVESTNPSVRGVWSPFHVDKDFRFKI